jgi:hypothetical protein
MFAKFEALFFFTMDFLQTLNLQLYSGTAQLLLKNTFSPVLQVWFVYEKRHIFTLMILAEDTETKRFFQIFDSSSSSLSQQPFLSQGLP